MKKHKPKYETGYLYKVFDHTMTHKLIPATIKALKASGLQFDAIAFRGMSGCLFGAVLAYRMNKPMLLVRKDNDSNHMGSRQLLGDLAAKTYIIVDDFIESGTTVRTIQSKLYQWIPEARCVGIVTASQVLRLGRETIFENAYLLTEEQLKNDL